MQKNIKILVGYHKPAPLFKSDIIVPIHLGRALANQESKDGTVKPEDYQWMLDNMIGDNTGDNISELNRYFNEMTGIYWAWKNYDKLGNPDIIGFMHYRRLFYLQPNIKAHSALECCGLTQDIIESHMKKYDFLTAPFLKWTLFSKSKNLYEQYKESEIYKHKIEYFNFALNVAKEHNPQMISIIDEAVFGPETGGFCNMFIMKKEDFFAYCKWLFDILFVLYQHIKDEDLDVCTKRNVGWTAERLSSVFFFALAKNHTHEDLEVIELKNLKKLSWCKYVKALVFAKIKKNKQKYLRQINRYRLFNFIQN